MDKRFCGVCATKGHASSECPRRLTRNEQLDVDAMGVRPLAPIIPFHAVTKSSAYNKNVISVENVTHGGKRNGAGRKSQYATNADKQKAYRERNHA